MRSADLFVVAAGWGSRMKANVPKALIPISGEPCLTNTLQQVSAKFRSIFIVSNILVQDEWNQYLRSLRSRYPELASRLVNLPIESGLGDGHATLQGILAAERAGPIQLSEDIVVIWGDVFVPDGRIFDELLSIPMTGSGLLPTVLEISPYVTLAVNERMQCLGADFSKYGEVRDLGLHDQSVFRFSTEKLKKSLSDLHSALWKSGRYISAGGELSLLYSFHHLYNCGDAAYVYETQFPTVSFNTVDELFKIERDMDTSRRRTPASNDGDELRIEVHPRS